MEPAAVAAGMPHMVPLVGTLRIEFVELSQQSVLLRLPDDPAFHNHIGGPHAGAMFSLAETASGALVLANFGDLLSECTPLAVHGEIDYRKIAMGDLWAHAHFTDSAADLVRAVQAGERREFSIAVSLFTHTGSSQTETSRTDTGEASFIWTLRPTRRTGRSDHGSSQAG